MHFVCKMTFYTTLNTLYIWARELCLCKPCVNLDLTMGCRKQDWLGPLLQFRHLMGCR